MSDPSVRKFQWGVALAWMPWIPRIAGCITTLRGVSNSKAIGLGGLGRWGWESFMLWGAARILAAQLTAIAFLFKSFEHGHPMRSAVSAISICASGLSLLLMAACFWLLGFRLSCFASH